MIPGDTRYDSEGWHYGVMFTDRSVFHPWNGETQRRRAEQQIEWWLHRGMILELVRQRGGKPWEPVPARTNASVR